jgi:hypothetical protein
MGEIHPMVEMADLSFSFQVKRCCRPSILPGLAPNEHHASHAHFYCNRCGQMDCLRPETFSIDSELLKKTFPGEIARVEIRVEGIWKNCLRH